MFETVLHLSLVLCNIRHYNFKPIFDFGTIKYHLPRLQSPVCPPPPLPTNVIGKQGQNYRKQKKKKFPRPSLSQRNNVFVKPFDELIREDIKKCHSKEGRILGMKLTHFSDKKKRLYHCQKIPYLKSEFHLFTFISFAFDAAVYFARNCSTLPLLYVS